MRWGWIYGEKLEIQSIQLVCNHDVSGQQQYSMHFPSPWLWSGRVVFTYRNHAFTVTVQVFHKRLTEAVNFSFSAFGEVATQKATLLFQTMHEICQLLNNTFVFAEILLFRQYKAEIENEFVAIILRRLHADWVSQDPIAIGANLNQIATQFLARDHEERDIGEGKERRLEG